MFSFTASLLVLNSLVDSLPIGSKTWMQGDLLWMFFLEAHIYCCSEFFPYMGFILLLSSLL